MTHRTQTTMTDNNQDRDLMPAATDDEGGGNRPLGPIRDPLAEVSRGTRGPIGFIPPKPKEERSGK